MGIVKMFIDLEKCRFHQVILTCAILLETPEFQTDSLPYQMFVWGGLAIAMSAFNLSDICIQSCICEIEKRVVFESDKFDSALFRQEVYAHQGKFIREREMFDFIYNSRLPKFSGFCLKSLKIHLKTSMEQFDNRVCEICLHQKMPNMTNKVAAKVAMSFADIKRIKKIIYSLLALDRNNFKFLEEDLCRLEIYFDFFKFTQYQFPFNSFLLYTPISKMASHPNLKTHFGTLAKFLNPTSFWMRLHDYENHLKKRKRYLENVTRQKSPKDWADLCFTQSIFNSS